MPGPLNTPFDEQAERNLLELRARYEQHTALSEVNIQIAGRSRSWLVVKEPDRVLDKAAVLPDAAKHNPYWATRWPSASGLDLHLSSLDLKGHRVLELGCGSGIAGCSAALRGAKVTITDAVEHAVELARLNTWTVRSNCRFEVLEWASLGANQKYPFVIGADLVYDEKQFVALEACVRNHLQEAGVFILAEPGRRTGQEFVEHMREKAWQPTSSQVQLDSAVIHIHEFRRAES